MAQFQYHYEVQTWLVVNNHTNEYLGSVEAAGSSAALRKAYKQYPQVLRPYIGIELVNEKPELFMYDSPERDDVWFEA